MRIPGIGKGEAGEVAAEVSRALAQQAWRWPRGGSVGDLHLKIAHTSDRSRDALVASIVTAMVKAIDAKALKTESNQNRG